MAQRGLVDPNLDALIQHLAKSKQEGAYKRVSNQAVPWMRPELNKPPKKPGDTPWDGDLQTREGVVAIHNSFNTDKAEEALKDAFTKGTEGNSADGIVLSLQIDYAAQAERAFRARNTQTFPRAVAHYSAREKGHGQPSGALVGQALDYFAHILKQGSEGTGGEI